MNVRVWLRGLGLGRYEESFKKIRLVPMFSLT